MSWVGAPDVASHQGYWQNFSAGLLNDFMAASYKDAGAPAGTSTDVIAEIAAAGGSAFLTSLVFGPEAGVAGALLEGGKDAFQTATESQLKAPFSAALTAAFGNGTGDSGNVSPADLTSASSLWDTVVRQSAAGPGGGQPGLRPDGSVYLGPNAPASVGGRNVLYYEQQYGGTFFDASTGTLLPLDKVQQDPRALAAYNAWLQDPAVSYANGQEFAARATGQVWGGYARGFSQSSGGG